MDRVRCFTRSLVVVFALAAVMTIGPAARSAPRSEDPDWPCQAPLVPKLAAATYWSAPLDTKADWHADPTIVELVARLAPRRVTTEEGLDAIAGFAKPLSADRSRRLALVFRGLLDETDRERAALIEELKEIGRRQRELADLVGRLGAQLNTIPPGAVGEDAARRVDLQQRYDFSARNFDEIQRTIRYACETPVELDARLGAWARALQQAATR